LNGIGFNDCFSLWDIGALLLRRFFFDIPVTKPSIIEEYLVTRRLARRISAFGYKKPLGYEKLEQRQLLASINLDGGTVTVIGNATDDLIELVGNADLQNFTVRINSVPTLTEAFRYAEVTQVMVYAGSGNDRVNNTVPIDSSIFGGLGNDYLEGGYRNDSLFGGQGSDTLVGRNGDDTLRGQEGSDLLYGGRGADELFGFDGNDWLVGGFGDDYLQGDAGNDVLRGQDGDDQLVGLDGHDHLYGESGNDVLAGQNGNDLLVGGTGDDHLQGNTGNDLLNGNEDNDTINAGPGNDTVNGGTGNDIITGFEGANFLNGNGGDDQINGGISADRIRGGSGSDYLAGNQGDDVLIGGFGNDRMEGGPGNDLLNGNEDNDFLNAGLGDDTINGGAGDDIITGVDGTNFLNGNGGDDRINGGLALDNIQGGSGDDFLSGNEGKDVLLGGSGDDQLFGGSGDDHLTGAHGNDFLFGQEGNDFLVSDQGNDRINGNSGSDILNLLSDEVDSRVVRAGTNFRVTDLRIPAQSHGIDLLIDIESLAFGNDDPIVKSIADTIYQPFPDSIEVVGNINEVLPDGWKSRARIVGNDIWLRTVKPNGEAHLDFRLGSAGVIAEIRDFRTGKSLLAPRFRNELTDRVVQWTAWELGQTVRHNVPSLPNFEDRFNLTQAGTFDNVLNGTVDVDFDSRTGQVDVWSVVDRNWKSEQDPHMSGTLTAFTRTQILDGGAILVRRIVRMGEIRLNGKSVSLDGPYLEAWTPLSDSTFNSMAIDISGRGNPNHWFADGRDIPHYPNTPVQETRGWATAYHRQTIRTSNNLSVVFGTDKGTVYRADGSETTSHQYNLNSFDFDGGLAILPGLYPGKLQQGSIIDQHLILLPGEGINASTPTQLDALAKQIPPPRIFHPGAELGDEISAIAIRLSTLTGERRVATDNIGPLR
jgi:Ca2+-binding RTX toxin-like protein